MLDLPKYAVVVKCMSNVGVSYLMIGRFEDSSASLDMTTKIHIGTNNTTYQYVIPLNVITRGGNPSKNVDIVTKTAYQKNTRWYFY